MSSLVGKISFRPFKETHVCLFLPGFYLFVSLLLSTTRLLIVISLRISWECARKRASGEGWVSLSNQDPTSYPPLARQFRTDGPDAHGLLVHLGRTCCFAQPLHDVGVTVVEEATGFDVQRPDRRHIFLAQIEIEDGEVFHDSFLAD